MQRKLPKVTKVVEEGWESGLRPGPTFSTTERPSPGRSKVAWLSDRHGLMRAPPVDPQGADSSLSLRKPPSLPSLPRTPACAAYSQLNICQITKPCRSSDTTHVALVICTVITT